MEASRMRNALTQIRMEYIEMPDLKLTLGQAGRLFGIPAGECEAALQALVSLGFLGRTRDGAFFRTDGSASTAA
jgi:hypothetical protein